MLSASVVAGTEALGMDALRDALHQCIPEAKRASAKARTLVDEPITRAKVLGPTDVAVRTEVVEFENVGEPTSVGMHVPMTRKVRQACAAAFESLADWLARGIAERYRVTRPRTKRQLSCDHQSVCSQRGDEAD